MACCGSAGSGTSALQRRTGSIFLDGLVGGMFLAALLDTDYRVYKLGLYDKCDSK